MEKLQIQLGQHVRESEGQIYTYEPKMTSFVSEGKYYHDYYYGGSNHFSTYIGNPFSVIPQYFHIR